MSTEGGGAAAQADDESEFDEEVADLTSFETMFERRMGLQTEEPQRPKRPPPSDDFDAHS